MKKHFSPRAFISAVLLAISAQASALSVGVPVGAGPVINPFNGQQTEVWKLVGETACSASQISRDWVASSFHCKLENGAVFSNLMALPTSGTPGSVVTDCLYGPNNPPPGYDDDVRKNDYTVCRLVNPENFLQLPSYPPLTSLPAVTKGNASRLGQLLAFGYGRSLINFVDFAGMPFGFDAALDPDFATVPVPHNGDSSGGFYWFSPVSGKPAIIGVIKNVSYLNQPDAGHFTAQNLQVIAAHTNSVCQSVSCTPPTFIDASTHYNEVAIDPASDLPVPPTTSGVYPSLTLSWAASPPVSGGGAISYDVTLGLGGGKLTASQTGLVGTSMIINSLPVGLIRACVLPRNENGGRASSGYATGPGFVSTPNCTYIDTRLPAPVANIALPVTPSTSSSFRRVAVNWSPVNSATVAPSVKFEVLRSVRLPGASTTRNTLLLTTATSVSGVDVVRGSTVCAKVTSISAVSQRGSSVTQCVVAN